MTSTPLLTLVIAAMRRVRDVLGYALAALGASAFATLLVPVFIAFALLATALARGHRQPSRALDKTLLAGFVLAVQFAVPVFAFVATGSHFGPGAGTVARLGVSMALTAIAAPFLTTASHLFRRDRGLIDALTQALAASTLRGVLPTLARGAMPSALIVVALVGFGLVGLLASPGSSAAFAWALFLLELALSIGVVLTFSHTIAFVAVCAEDDERLLGAEPAWHPGSVLWSSWLAPLVALAALLLATSLPNSEWILALDPRCVLPLALLVVGFFALLVLAFSMGRMDARVHALGAADARILSGRLREDGAFVTSDDMHTISGPPAALALPDAPDDAPLYLVTPAAVASRGFRSDAEPCPEGAVLLRGTGGPAVAAALVRARIAAPWLASSGIAFGLAAFLISVST